MNRSMEDDYRFRLWAKGYRVHDEKLWYILNDDPDDYREALIGPLNGSYIKAWQALERRNWPTQQAWGPMYV